jgi:hypothetical protein
MGLTPKPLVRTFKSGHKNINENILQQPFLVEFLSEIHHEAAVFNDNRRQTGKKPASSTIFWSTVKQTSSLIIEITHLQSHSSVFFCLISPSCLVPLIATTKLFSNHHSLLEKSHYVKVIYLL